MMEVNCYYEKRTSKRGETSPRRRRAAACAASAGQNKQARPARPAAAHGRAPPARPPGDRGAATGLLVRPINFATRTLFILNPDKALPSHDAAPNDQIKYAFAPHDAKTAIS
ncbi:hypothetical protein EVAR_98366_1 [Eumeta japonica]|uniref:Uncharacterized protein n=1 Tax=Eumeta variegata TaxID=151549 RepID=A0A4C2A5K2_EUMVA|nr:hypothetical protein EVAR_98366_1 [Eumeta japonica]